MDYLPLFVLGSVPPSRLLLVLLPYLVACSPLSSCYCPFDACSLLVGSSHDVVCWFLTFTLPSFVALCCVALLVTLVLLCLPLTAFCCCCCLWVGSLLPLRCIYILYGDLLVAPFVVDLFTPPSVPLPCYHGLVLVCGSCCCCWIGIRIQDSILRQNVNKTTMGKAFIVMRNAYIFRMMILVS